MEIDMDSSSLHHHHHQEMSSQTLESMLVCTKAQQEKKPRPPEQALKCPRCDSTNTKFCYYNNYSPTQPRYFCKSCRRYWTKGGTLRKVPVGGGCRKNKRSSSSSKRTQDLHRPLITSNLNNPNIDPLISSLVHLPYDSTTDLSLAFARLQSEANGHLGFDHNDHFLGNPQRISHSGHGFLGLLEGTPNPNNGFHENHVFYGGNIGNGEMGSVENGGNGIIMGIDDQEEMGMNINPFHDHQEHTTTGAETTAVSVTTVKQESCNGRSDNQCGENNRVLWGFPWQIGGENGNNMVEVDSGRVQNGNGWNGLGSTWHGLLNSPLM